MSISLCFILILASKLTFISSFPFHTPIILSNSNFYPIPIGLIDYNEFFMLMHERTEEINKRITDLSRHLVMAVGGDRCNDTLYFDTLFETLFATSPTISAVLSYLHSSHFFCGSRLIFLSLFLSNHFC